MPSPHVPVRDIVLATDFSCRCDRAFERASRLAVDWRASLHVIAATEHDFHQPSWRDARRAALGGACAELENELATRGVPADLAIVDGDPYETVVAAAEGKNAQLIVVGVARNELVGRSRPGRTVEALLRHAPAPVLVVKRRAAGPYRRILIPNDFSTAAELAAARATALFPEAEFTLLHGYRVAFSGFVAEKANKAELQSAAESQQARFLERLRKRVGAAVHIRSLIEYGLPEGLVTDYVHAEAPDLVVIGARPGGLAPSWLNTGMAERLLMGAQCDVLAVPEASETDHSASATA